VNPSDHIRTYIHAKDANRPHLLARAFAPDAVVALVVNTPNISFPPVVSGLDAVSDALISGFGRTYENVYTFCLSEPPGDGARRFTCDWLVGMSEKQNGAVRLGCGRYDWQFGGDAAGLIERLTITIDTMERLPSDKVLTVMDWLSRLPYPWCPARVAIERAPAIDDVTGVMRRLR
jgi:hypothetical protein